MKPVVVTRGEGPLLVSIPHAGTDIPPDIEERMVSPWLSRLDTDFYVDKLYAFVEAMGASIVRTPISRTVIDMNRDPSGDSLYPGMATTGLCPDITFNGEPLYRKGQEPDAADIEHRRRTYFQPYHEALDEEIARLRQRYDHVLVLEAHSIASVVPRLFDGELPNVNIGTAGGASCAPVFPQILAERCRSSAFSHVENGRFKGGWTTRRLGRPEEGIHAIQIELAMRGYLDEPAPPHHPANWPPAYDPARAAPLQALLKEVLSAWLDRLCDMTPSGERS